CCSSYRPPNSMIMPAGRWTSRASCARMALMAVPRSTPSRRAVTAIDWRRPSRLISVWPGSYSIADTWSTRTNPFVTGEWMRGAVFAEEADLDGGGRAGQIADQIAEDADELHAQRRLGRLDLLPQFGGDLVRRAMLVAKLHGEVARVRLGHAGQSELQPGAAREALHIRRLFQQPLDVQEHAIGFGQRRAGRRDVV